MRFNNILEKNGKLYSPDTDAGFTEETVRIDDKPYR